MSECMQELSGMPFEGMLLTPHERVKMVEMYLFNLKKIARESPQIHGKMTMESLSPYRCTTCKHTVCLHYGMDGFAGKIIRAQTGLNGCLEWRNSL